MPKAILKLADVSNVAPGEGKVVEADGRCFALFNVDGSYYVADNKCSHRGGPLGEGRLTGDVVTCPWHRAEFNVRTGEVVELPARVGLTVYPVKVENETICVELE